MTTYLYNAQIIVAVALIIVALLQVRGGERTLFQLTIALVAIFVILSIVSLRVNA
jgi:preprotein translocase subunit SecG